MVGARARACVTTEGYPLAGLQQQLRRRVTAMEENLDRPQLAGQRLSSPSASGLIVVGR